MIDIAANQVVVRGSDKNLSNISGASYHVADNVWTFPKVMLPEVMETKDDHTSAVDEAMEELSTILRSRESVPEYHTLTSFKTTPYDHQKLAFNLCLQNPQFALLLEMGLGKTKIMIDVMNYRLKREQIKKVLVVSPKSVMGVWANELVQHGDYPGVVVDGTMSQRKRKLAYAASVFIINYDAVHTLQGLLKLMDFDMIVCDESIKIKSPTTKITKALLRLAPSVRFRYILTGTPIGNNLADIYTQFKFLRTDIFPEKSYTAFLNKWAIKERHHNYFKIIGYRDYTAVIRQVAPYSLRMTKEECVDLPPKIYKRRVVEMNKRQEAMYTTLRRDLLAAIRSKEVSISNAGGLFNKLSQIAGGTIKTDDGGVAILGSAKAQELRSIYEEHGGPIIVWCKYVAEIQYLKDQFKDLRVASIQGSTKNRQEILDDFQNGLYDKLICQVDTGALGLTLTRSCLSVDYSYTFSYTSYAQAHDRIHRIGQEKDCLYISLITEGTPDEHAMSALAKKGDLSTGTLEQIASYL